MVGAYHECMSDCWPWFHASYSAIAREPWGRKTIPSGCSINPSTGDVGCAPASMAANAEAWLAKNYPQFLVQVGGSIDVYLYSLARYTRSEVGSGTVEEMVAVAEAAINEARRRKPLAWKAELMRMLAPTGFYGPIHALEEICLARGFARGSKQNRCTDISDPRTCCAPFNRWAASTSDPTIISLLCAHLAYSGLSDDFAKGAVTQWGPEVWIKEGQSRLTKFVKQAANDGKFWVGPLPGVDPFHTFLVTQEKYTGGSPAGAMRQELGIAALTLPRKPAPTPPETSVCGSKPEGLVAAFSSYNGRLFLMLSAGLALGGVAASVVAHRYARAPNER